MRRRNFTMNKPVIAAVLFSALTLGVGCKHDQKDPMATAPPPPTAAASVAEINSAKFLNAQVPQAVQTAFMKDYPKAAVETISLRSTSAGQSFYEIRFMQDG